MELPLPLISLQDRDAVNTGKLQAACTEHGFFLVQGHGITDTLLATAFDHFKQFFALPEADKRAILHDKHAKGYQPFGQQTLDYGTQKQGDTKETWAAMDDSLSAPEDGSPYRSPNQWPQDTKVPGFKAPVEELVRHLKGLRDRVNRLMAMALDKPSNFFESYFQTPLDMLRAFHYYSPEGSCPDDGRLGAGAHTDWGHITYLMTDGTPGLEILYQGRWMPVPYIPGTFVCNICDLLQLWSGGKFKSTKHRVVIGPNVHRYSFAYFTVPAWDAYIQPLQQQQQQSLTAVEQQNSTAIHKQHPREVGQSQQQHMQLCLAGEEGIQQQQQWQEVRQLPADFAQQSSHEQQQQQQQLHEQQQRQQQGVAIGSERTLPSDTRPPIVIGGEAVQLGSQGIRVLDYIQAKYKAHFADAGEAQSLLDTT